MDHLSLHDPPPSQGGGPLPPAGPLGPQMLGRPPPPPQQLPAQMFTTAAQLLDLTDTNLVLQSTVERIFVTPDAVPATHPNSEKNRGIYADLPRGMFLVRGENVMLLGEIDLDRDDDPPLGYDLADAELVERLAKGTKAQEKNKDKKKQKSLSALGFEGEAMGDVLL